MSVVSLVNYRAARDEQAEYEERWGYWGLCPDCHRTDGCLNVGGNHWFHCEQHRTRWCVGWNLFSAWRDEPESVHKRNAEKLSAFKDVNPYHSPHAHSGYSEDTVASEGEEAPF
jgi:hypothetical protein